MELLHHSLVPLQQHIIHRKVPNERTPFSSHIGYREAIVDRQCGDTIARKFDSGIENLVLVKRAAQRDYHVLPGDTSDELSSQLDFDDTGHLPPGSPSRPYGRRVSSDDRRADAPHAPVHIAVAVRRDREGMWKRIAFFDKDLMADSTTSGVKIDSLRARKRFDVGIFGQILG